MSYKPDRYASRKDVDELEEISERLAADLRKSIRQLDNHPILSDAWIEMAEIFGRIARVSDMESKLPSAKKDATLWETEEQALRFLLEDGKLNLCLRILVEFKAKQSEARKNRNGPMIDFVAECDKFEKGLGVVMKNAWEHIEVLQTTDLVALIHHIGDIFEQIINFPDTFEPIFKSSDINQRQELLIFYYLNSVLRHIEDIREARLMPTIRDRNIFQNGITILLTYGPLLLSAHRFVACEALALLAGTEDFSTFPQSYYNMKNPTETSKMIEFREKIVTELMSNLDQRKALRPLTDILDKVKRLARHHK